MGMNVKVSISIIIKNEKMMEKVVIKNYKVTILIHLVKDIKTGILILTNFEKNCKEEVKVNFKKLKKIGGFVR